MFDFNSRNTARLSNEMRAIATILFLLVVGAGLIAPARLFSQSEDARQDVLLQQSQAEADRKSRGRLSCHTATDSPTMHASGEVRLGCIDCHGGDNEIQVKDGT